MPSDGYTKGRKKKKGIERDHSGQRLEMRRWSNPAGSGGGGKKKGIRDTWLRGMKRRIRAKVGIVMKG